jgi:4-hydroxy-tetrahydrodipicolinate reductase
VIRALVTGAAGRMGSQIIRIIHETEGIALGGAVERPGHPSVGRDAGELAGLGSLGVVLSDDFAATVATCDVVVDFTSAEASLRHVDLTARAGKAIVVGSTGFAPADLAAMRARTDCRIFLTANMSVGMNVLFRLVGEAARMLGDDFDVEIVETHHRFKKDAPSGSAKRLAEAVASALGRDADADTVHGRAGMVGERTRREIGMHAVRAGDVVGDHTVIFGALGERLELTHKASSRETFARGAVRAALWISNQKPGVHDMMELLGLK